MKTETKQQLLESKKEKFAQAFNNRATLKTWKGQPIWAYCYITDETIEIRNHKKIRFLLSRPQLCTFFFLTEEDMENFRWGFNYIDNEVNRRIQESFDTGKYFENFVEVKDIGQAFTIEE